MALRRWLGRALAVQEHERLAVTGTWTQGDTIDLTINFRTITITIGSTTDLATVTTLIAAAWNGEVIAGDHTFSETGNNIPEFAEIEATADVTNNRVELRMIEKGKPFTFSKVVTTADTGDLTQSEVTAGTGPNYADNADNWEGGILPADGDDILFDSGSVDCLYGLDLASTTPATIRFTMGWEGSLGLPITNVDNPQGAYREYRRRHLRIGDPADLTTIEVEIGAGEGNGSERIYLEFVLCPVNVQVHNSRSRSILSESVISIIASATTNTLTVNGGDVEVGGVSTDDESHLATLIVNAGDSLEAAAISIGTRVVCTDVCDLDDAAITLNGGELVLNSGVVTGSIRVNGGELTLDGDEGFNDLDVFGGTCFYNGSGTLADVRLINGGRLDFRNKSNTRTVTTARVFENCALLDPHSTATFTNDIIVEASLSRVTIDLGPTAVVNR